jgi:hypothetical protein
LPQPSPTLPQGLEGGNPLCVKIFLGKIFYENDFCAFSTVPIMESFDQMRAHVSGKVDRAEGLLRLRDTDTSLITFREK